MLAKNDLTKQIGLKIRELRLKKGISQEELAHKSGLYRTYVGHIEVGKYTPSVYTIYRIAKALNIQGSEIISF